MTPYQEKVNLDNSQEMNNEVSLPDEIMNSQEQKEYKPNLYQIKQLKTITEPKTDVEKPAGNIISTGDNIWY